MQVTPDLTKVTEFAAIDHELTERIDEIRVMLGDAKAFVESKAWCSKIVTSYIGFAFPGVVAVFLFHIIPSRNDVDEWIWVIVGDLPTAYITCDKAPTPAMALNGYLGALEEWISAVKAGKSVEDLIPVNAKPTKHYADMLETRIKFIDQRILSEYANGIKK